MNQFDYNEPPEIQAAAQRVRAAAFGKYRPENWKEPEPAEPKPLRVEEAPKRPERTLEIGKPKYVRSNRCSKDGLGVRPILDALKRGDRFAEIGEAHGIPPARLKARIVRTARRDPEVAKEWAAMLICDCKRVKAPSSRVCHRCKGKGK